MSLSGKSIFISFLTLLSTSLWASDLPTIELPLGEKDVSELCFDSGYIREVNFTNKKNVRPILQKTVLRFIDGSEYTKNDFISSEYTYYNRETRTFDKTSIDECKDQLIDAPFIISQKDKEASKSENVFYGNLKNYGVNDSAMEVWKKWGTLNRYLKYSAEKDRVTLVTNFSELAEQSQLNHFAAWKELSGKVIGGEQSGGGGAGRVRVNMNMAADDLRRVHQGQNGLERLFGMTSLLDGIIFDNKKLHRGKVWVTVPKR